MIICNLKTISRHLFHPHSAKSPCNFSAVRAWRRQTTIPMCLHTTQPWSTTSREKAHWQAASARLLHAAQTETKTTTTSTTGDHAFRNLPTCTIHAKVDSTSQKKGLRLGHLWRWSFPDWRGLRINAEGCQENENCRFFGMSHRFYWESCGQNQQNDVSSSAQEKNETCIVMISHKEKVDVPQGIHSVCWNDFPPLVLFILRHGFNSCVAYKQEFGKKNESVYFFIYIYMQIFYKTILLWYLFVFLALILNSPFQPLLISLESQYKISV